MLAIITIAVVLLVLTVWLASVPIEFQISIDTETSPKFNTRICWLYRLVCVRIDSSKQSKRWIRDASRPEKKRKERITNGNAWPFIRAILNTEGFLSRVLQFVFDILRTIEFRDNALEVQFGLSDPADTGLISGIVGPIFLAIPNAAFVPDFNNELLVIKSRGSIRIVPLRLLTATIMFLVSPPALRAVGNAIRASR